MSRTRRILGQGDFLVYVEFSSSPEKLIKERKQCMPDVDIEIIPGMKAVAWLLAQHGPSGGDSN